MTNEKYWRKSERGGAGVKFLFILVAIVVAANAGYQYIPVAYNGASLKQEMDTAVVKGLAASGQMKPMEVVLSSIQRAMKANDTPEDAVVEVAPVNGVIHARIAYTKQISMLPFGLYKYTYKFDHTSTPTGYLMKE